MVQELSEARDELEEAAKTADDDDAREEIREVADSFKDYTVGDHEPDHAILDEHLNQLRQLSERTNTDTQDRVDNALDIAEEYRKQVDQA
ncbi:uncharacterized protein Nmag_2067 [Natrialba magadii ATCC 43099]|uniref:Uncharacterized protein n=1 Tax=Natrialba magadii (strain ATCC 43099 / DSM 3394 / CCM 3739 / CIP 104546 / IAM 13178 / JCM 8861 / NBRC 102185 / NCIMB 2190 / MS3) TaxID=547559 RepID=D3SVM9_NATMM|nr:hypothetical protein [Natrialba magadii]ADD05637.1 uncharacterized protein Nmag_2067 [Natrialba magadii ATCC 43099]ELY29950.1 hypothetical protein C500_10079 [Natrialba magadii ATCC 43099]